MVTMRLLTSRHVCILCVAILVASCRNGNIFDSPAEVVRPGVCNEVSGTQLVSGNDYPPGIVNIIVADSALVLKTSNSLNHNQFHIYNLSSGQHIGSCVRRGRGPGELISPVLSGTFSDKGHGRSLYIFALNDNAAFGLDKRKAVKGRWRISEKTLLAMCLFMGATGGWAGMKIFHHKTAKWYFAFTVPAMAVLQIWAIVYFTYLA